MFIFPILLSMGLDLSLPEFQPDVDVSGNYIVSSFDVSSDDISDNDFSVSYIVPDSVVLSNVDTVSDDDIVSAINQLNEDNNNYWELFLDSYPIEVSHVLRSTYVSGISWKFTSSGSISSAGGSGDLAAYIPVEIGLTYYISGITSPSYNTFRYGVVNSLDSPTVVTNFGSGNISELTVSPSQSGYLVFYINYSREVGFLAEWNTIEQESYTLSELGNAVVSMRDEFNIKFRALLFVCLFIFLYPIAMSICKNIVGGKK